jgi:hypothetical protein
MSKSVAGSHGYYQSGFGDQPIVMIARPPMLMDGVHEAGDSDVADAVELGGQRGAGRWG